MPLAQIDISKGSYKGIDPISLRNGFAAELKNQLIDDSGANVDRPALSSFVSLGSSPIIGLHYWEDQNKMVAVTENRQVWSITSAGVATKVSAANDLEGTDRPVFAEDGTYLAIAGGGEPDRWDGSGNTESMPGTPEDTNFVKYNDGYWLLLLKNDQEIRIAGPTSATRESWSSADFFQSESEPDIARCIEVSRDEVYVFGKRSLEIFQNLGDSSTPYQPVLTVSGQGTNSPYSIIKYSNGKIAWLDHNKRIMSLEGRTATHLSGPYDKLIQGFNTVSDCWSAHIEIDGHYLITFTFPTEQYTIVYDYVRGNWSEWDGFEAGESTRLRMNAHCQAFSNKHYVGDYENGNIYLLSMANKSDTTNPLRRLRRTEYIDHGAPSVRKRNIDYTFTVKRGLGSSGGVEPYVQLRFRDDGKDWSEPYLLGLGLQGDAFQQVSIRNTGVYRTRQIEITMTEEVDFVLANPIVENFEALAR